MSPASVPITIENSISDEMRTSYVQYSRASVSARGLSVRTLCEARF